MRNPGTRKLDTSLIIKFIKKVLKLKYKYKHYMINISFIINIALYIAIAPSASQSIHMITTIRDELIDNIGDVKMCTISS